MGTLEPYYVVEYKPSTEDVGTVMSKIQDLGYATGNGFHCLSQAKVANLKENLLPTPFLWNVEDVDMVYSKMCQSWSELSPTDQVLAEVQRWEYFEKWRPDLSVLILILLGFLRVVRKEDTIEVRNKFEWINEELANNFLDHLVETFSLSDMFKTHVLNAVISEKRATKLNLNQSVGCPDNVVLVVICFLKFLFA